MAWSNSKIFSVFIQDALNRTSAYDLNADTFKAALFNNSITPDQTFDATDTPQGGASTTLANVYGCLVYDDTTSDLGVCYNYFGGANSVTAGTFTVVWNTSGIFALTL